MKRLKYILCSLLAVSTLTSCTDWLNEEHRTKVTTEFLYSNEEALERGVIALYSVDRSFFRKDEQISPYAYVMDIGTDLDWFRGGGGSNFANYTNFTTRNANVKDFWSHQYGIIGKSNEILAAAETMNQESKLIQQIIGEASMFRAHAYYWLWIKFGRIFVTTEPTTYENMDKMNFRPATNEEVFKRINDDLEVAITNLSWEPLQTSSGAAQYGRFTKAVAKHVKAKVAMWQDDWDEAIKQCEEIFDAPTNYTLLNDPGDTFEGGNLNHSETIFAYQFKDGIGGGGALGESGLFMGHRLGLFTVAQYRIKMKLCDFDNGGYGWGRLMPNNYLLSLYKDKKKDKRYQQYFRHYFVKTREDQNPANKQVGDTIYPGSAAEYWDNYHPQTTKYVDKWTALIPEQTTSFKDVIMYRLAETYLIASEAYMRKGDQTNAKKYYNKTWMRAGNTEEMSEISLQMIMDEHARELCLEGHRFSFLKRIGKLFDQVRTYGGEYTTNSSAAGKGMGVDVPTSYYKKYVAPATSADRRYYFKKEYENWPIPQSEVDQMGADKFPPNPGYE